MQILFRCHRCFKECRASPTRDTGVVVCPACRKQQVLRYTEAQKTQNIVDSCAVCQQEDFYIRDEARKVWGLAYVLGGLGAAYLTYGASLVLGGFGFYWHFWKYPKLTVCYHCYAKYRNCRLNPKHQEYNLEKMATLEKAIRNDRTFRDFR
jgi:hypothetical protein